MAMKKRTTGSAEKRVKTSLSLPEHLWDAAKRRALDERTEFQVIVARALEAYLKKGGSK